MLIPSATTVHQNTEWNRIGYDERGKQVQIDASYYRTEPCHMRRTSRPRHNTIETLMTSIQRFITSVSADDPDVNEWCSSTTHRRQLKNPEVWKTEVKSECARAPDKARWIQSHQTGNIFVGRGLDSGKSVKSSKMRNRLPLMWR